MRRTHAALAAALSFAAVSIFLHGTTSVSAQADKVAFPPYQTHVLYDILDQPENKEVRELFVNPEAMKAVRAGQPVPSGTVFSAPTFKAVLDDKGEMVRDSNGRLIRGRLDRVVVMEKRTGWGAQYPADLRNGEWEYAVFGPNGTLRAKANYAACFKCHQPQAKQDFVFSFAQLLKAAQR
jgi:Cytochrome P460